MTDYSRVLNLVDQVKSQARGLRRYKRRVERLRKALLDAQMREYVAVHMASRWLLDEEGGLYFGCLTGDCPHENRGACINSIRDAILTYWPDGGDTVKEHGAKVIDFERRDLVEALMAHAGIPFTLVGVEMRPNLSDRNSLAGCRLIIHEQVAREVSATDGPQIDEATPIAGQQDG